MCTNGTFSFCDGSANASGVDVQLQAAGVRSPFNFSDPRFSKLIRSDEGYFAVAAPVTEVAPLQDRLAQARERSEATKVIHDAQVAQVAKLLWAEGSETDHSKPLHKHGVDFLAGVEITNWIFQEMNVRVSMSDIGIDQHRRICQKPSGEARHVIEGAECFTPQI